MSDDPSMTLVSSALELVVRDLASGADADRAWAAAREALAHHGVAADVDRELSAAIDERDAATLTALVAGWTSGKRLMLERDRDVLKRALKAYRKSLKVTVLDAESSVAGGPMSAGRKSSITGIIPPNRYPREVWDELVRQKKLIHAGRGIYELAPGA
jgi:hypothetical protein